MLLLRECQLLFCYFVCEMTLEPYLRRVKDFKAGTLRRRMRRIKKKEEEIPEKLKVIVGARERKDAENRLSFFACRDCVVCSFRIPFCHLIFWLFLLYKLKLITSEIASDETSEELRETIGKTPPQISPLLPFFLHRPLSFQINRDQKLANSLPSN